MQNLLRQQYFVVIPTKQFWGFFARFLQYSNKKIFCINLLQFE